MTDLQRRAIDGRAPRLTQPQLWAELSQRLGVRRTLVREFLVELAWLSERELLNGREFVIPGIVTLVVDRRPDRMGRHPFTGETISIPRRMALKARLGRRLKDAVMGQAGR